MVTCLIRCGPAWAQNLRLSVSAWKPWAQAQSWELVPPGALQVSVERAGPAGMKGAC